MVWRKKERKILEAVADTFTFKMKNYTGDECAYMKDMRVWKESADERVDDEE